MTAVIVFSLGTRRSTLSMAVKIASGVRPTSSTRRRRASRWPGVRSWRLRKSSSSPRGTSSRTGRSVNGTCLAAADCRSSTNFLAARSRPSSSGSSEKNDVNDWSSRCIVGAGSHSIACTHFKWCRDGSVPRIRGSVDVYRLLSGESVKPPVSVGKSSTTLRVASIARSVSASRASMSPLVAGRSVSARSTSSRRSASTCGWRPSQVTSLTTRGGSVSSCAIRLSICEWPKPLGPTRPSTSCRGSPACVTMVPQWTLRSQVKERDA